MIEFRALAEEGKDRRPILHSTQEADGPQPELLMVQQGLRQPDRQFAFPDDQGPLGGDASRFRRPTQRVRGRPADDHGDRGERRDHREVAQVRADVQGKLGDRHHRHQQQEGDRHAPQQPGCVVPEAGVDPEDARRVAVEDQEREHGEHDRDGVEPHEDVHDPEGNRIGDGKETRKGRPEPQHPTSGKHHIEGFANRHPSRSAAGCTKHGPGDRALHTPLRGLENRVWRCDPFQRMRVSP